MAHDLPHLSPSIPITIPVALLQHARLFHDYTSTIPPPSPSSFTVPLERSIHELTGTYKYVSPVSADICAGMVPLNDVERKSLQTQHTAERMLQQECMTSIL